MPSAIVKTILNVLGVLFVLLGVLGLFLPLLPTTPFVLLASACFARGSSRLHDWLLRRRLFGAMIRDFEQGRGIPFKAKLTAILLLWTSMALSAGRLEQPLMVMMLFLVASAVSLYLSCWVPTLKPPAPTA